MQSLNVIAICKESLLQSTAADAKTAVNVRTAAPLPVIAAENVTADTAANAKTAASSLCSLLESIALNEAALSHILNAEGEKLQKAVQIADSIHDLLEIDRSVIQTLTRVTFLEQTLYAKAGSCDGASGRKLQ